MATDRPAQHVDAVALKEALALVSSRGGRLSNEQVKAMRRGRGRLAGGVAAALLAGLTVAGAAYRMSPPPAMSSAWTREVATRSGERRGFGLADGTTIWLNGGTRVRLRYTARRREVMLLAGEARFDVHHDANRPFLVHAAPGDVRVLGTVFDLDLTRSQIGLAVYRGAVRFEATASRQEMVVRAGFRTRLRADTIERPTRFDAAQPDWRQGWIDTAGMRLDDLVEVLNRTGEAAVARPPASLAGLPVSGRFRTDDPRQLLTAIGQGYGFAVAGTDRRIELAPLP